MSVDYADWRDRLATANDPAFWPIEAIDAEVVEGRAQFWCDGEAALVTRMVEYPGGANVLEALAGAGTLDGLLNIAPLTEGFAKSRGATHRMIPGRAGWQRVFKDWRLYQSALVKEVS